MALLTFVAAPAAAQSPNTASLLVTVVDQTGAVVQDAKVSVTNTSTGAVRELMSGADGSATIGALSLTGTYRINVTKAGFTAEDVTELTLRAGETATVKVKLVATGGTRRSHRLRHERRACAPTRRSASGSTARASTKRRSWAARSRRLPLFNSAFRQAKGTGDLFVNATYFVTGGGSRRTTTFMLDGANNDEAWGRQTMMADRAASARSRK